MSSPSLPPGFDKHHVVVLEAIHVPILPLNFPHTLTEYPYTTPEQVGERIKDATILIVNVVSVQPAHLDEAPHLQLLAVMATGMSCVDKTYCQRRGISVINCPAANIPAVSEHFLTLYFASRKKVVDVHNCVTTTSVWREKASITKQIWNQGPPLGPVHETLGIVGYGALGKRIEILAKAVGFGKVIISERKGITARDQVRPGRVTFDEILRTATTIVVVIPREPNTVDLIGDPELRLMKRECLLINIARGGIVNEAALATALKEGRIFGAATDVLDTEPGGPGSTPLIPDLSKGEERVPNLIVTSHVAWFSEQTIDTLQKMLRDGVEAFAYGRLVEDERTRCQIAVHDGRIWK